MRIDNQCNDTSKITTQRERERVQQFAHTHTHTSKPVDFETISNSLSPTRFQALRLRIHSSPTLKPTHRHL